MCLLKRENDRPVSDNIDWQHSNIFETLEKPFSTSSDVTVTGSDPSILWREVCIFSKYVDMTSYILQFYMKPCMKWYSILLYYSFIDDAHMKCWRLLCRDCACIILFDEMMKLFGMCDVFFCWWSRVCEKSLPVSDGRWPGLICIWNDKQWPRDNPILCVTVPYEVTWWYFFCCVKKPDKQRGNVKAMREREWSVALW